MNLKYKSGLNPRGALDSSPLYLFSKVIFKWQVITQIIFSIYRRYSIYSLADELKKNAELREKT